MNAQLMLRLVINPVLANLLPTKMNSREAKVMLLAIALQESLLQHRKQVGGPAKGFWQFEKNGGVLEILTQKDTKSFAEQACSALLVKPEAQTVYDLIQFNDQLACVWARLLLWRDPKRIAQNADEGWLQYLRNWRPGKPHPKTWQAHWDHASKVVNEAQHG
jgi:hypothetical protein